MVREGLRGEGGWSEAPGISTGNAKGFSDASGDEERDVSGLSGRIGAIEKPRIVAILHDPNAPPP